MSAIIAPKVTAITGPIRGETNIAATIFGELFSTRPRAAKELEGNLNEQIKLFIDLYSLCSDDKEDVIK